MRLKHHAIWVITLLLILLEQGIKLVINASHLNANTPILPPWLYFNPTFNRDYSWYNSMLNLGVGKWPHVIVVSVMIIASVLFYRFLRSRYQTSLFIDTTFAFLFSAATCSWIDKVFWNGSLDYIMLSGFFTFDLKDVYVNVFIGLIILMLVIDYRGVRKVDDRVVLREFVGFVLRKNGDS